MTSSSACPCGRRAYAECCRPLLLGGAQAQSAEDLMRSRYSAYAIGGDLGANHLFRTWHPRTRPEDTRPDVGLTWTGLTIVDVVDGAARDAEGVVEFTAHYRSATGPGSLHERSRFARRAGRWVYVDGDVS